MSNNEEIQSLVTRLYNAFNDSGFIGLGGTNEEEVLAVLKIAKAKGLMREVDAFYRTTYKEEPSLKEELDDELSGDDFDNAMLLYDEGMNAPAQSGAGAEGSGRKGAGASSGGSGSQGAANPVHGTMAPIAEGFSMYLLDFAMKPMPGAKCWLVDFPNKVMTADADGLVTLPLPQGRKTIDIEWTRGGTGNESDPQYILTQTVHVDFAGTDDAAVSKQLANLGFDGDEFADQLESFHAFLGGPKDEGFRTARADLDSWIVSENAPFPDRPPSGGNSRVA